MKKNFLTKVLVMVIAFTTLNINYVYASNKTPLNEETAAAISDGRIRYEGGKFDNTLYNSKILNPNEDEDRDGLFNRQEIYTYEKNGRTFYGYNSHPYLYDTDGDGYSDGDEVKRKGGTNPLKWDISPRDMALFMELAYRDDDYIRQVLNDELDSITNHKGRLEYTLMHNELAPYWKVKDTYHHSNGFDAVLFENVSKLPFVISNQVQVLGIRGTASANDFDDDGAIAFRTVPKQVDSLESTLRNYKDRNQAGENYVKNLYITGHSLGGYLAQWGAITSKREGLNFFKQAYTFNAPKISGNLFVNWVNDRARIGDELTDKGISVHYKTENDGTISSIGNFYGAKSIGNSSEGHGSRSYFEKRMNNIHRTHQIKGFNVGKRINIHNTGYKDPKLEDLIFFDNQAPNINITSGQKIFLWKYDENDSLPRYEIPITNDENPSTIETTEMYGNQNQTSPSNIGELRFEIDKANSKLVLTGKANVREGEYNRVLKIIDYPHTLFTNSIKFVIVSATPQKIVRKVNQPIDEMLITMAVRINYNNYRPAQNERIDFRLVNPLKANYSVGTHLIPVEVTNPSGLKKIVNVTLEITPEEPSQMPKSIKQIYSLENGQQIEVSFTNPMDDRTVVTLMKQNLQNQKIDVLKNNIPYKAIKKENKYFFEIDKNILNDGETYFVKVKEPNKKETISAININLDLNPPVISNSDLILLKDELYYNISTQENIEVAQNDAIKNINVVDGRHVIVASLAMENQGLIVKDQFGNEILLKPTLEVRGKVDVKRPIRTQKNLTITSDTNNLLGSVDIKKVTGGNEVYSLKLKKGENILNLNQTLKKGDVVTIKINGNIPIKFRIR